MPENCARPPAHIRIGGVDVTSLPVDARARLGLARSYQKNNLFNELTVRENLALAVATATGASAWLLHDTLADRGIADAVAEVAALTAFARPARPCRVDRISYGARRQLEVALALATRPRILLMDEPTSGIGPAMIAAFHGLLKSLPRDLTILIIEHDMDLAFNVADRITVMNYGEVVFEGDVGGNPRQPAGQRHLSRRVARPCLRSGSSRQATATPRSFTGWIWRSARAGCWRFSAATAPASRRRSRR